MITGLDYVFETHKTSYVFFMALEQQLSNTWANFIKSYDTDNGTLDIFYSKNQEMFDSMDEKGYNLDNNGEGTFLIIFNDDKSLALNSISLVLPDNTKESEFCAQIHDYVAASAKN